MARNGSGIYILPPSNPVVSGTVIESDWANDTMADLAAALTQSLSYDGQTVPIANLPMGGFRHTGVGEPTSRNQYVNLGMVQDGRHQRVTSLTGVDNLIGTLIGGATAYVAGALVSFFAPGTNTGAMTLNYNGIGPRSLTDSNGLALSAGEIQAGEFVMALYTGTEFRLLTSVDAAVAADLYNLSISGQVRPPSDVYPALTIATGTTVNVPAGTAWIVPPGNDTDDAVQVTWAAQTITMQFLTSSFTTFVMVDEVGLIQQIPGRAIGPNFRHMAVLGVVEHITGTVNNVITRPSIFGDDGYRSRDQASLLANTVVNGALVTPNAVSTLNLDVAQGTIFIPGGSANTVDSPNTFNIPPQLNIQFRTLAGQNTTSALTSLVPVANYDLNGAGVVAALPNPGDATIHRLFYLYGQYILAYGQQAYSSVENALSMIAWDRTKFKKSLYLADATLLAEVIAVRTATNLNIITQGAVVCPGGLNFSIGSPGGIAEAPIDGFPYGRRNAAWFQVLGSVAPVATNSFTVNGPAPDINQVQNPAGPGQIATRHKSGAFNWFTIETVNPDDKTYFRSYNPGSGALRFTTTYDLASGKWDFPVSPTVGGAPNNVVTCPETSFNLALARFNGVTGTSIKNSLVTLDNFGGLSGVASMNTSQLAGFRNVIINGHMYFNQRGAPNYTLDGYTVDRWQLNAVQIGATGVIATHYSLLPQNAPISQFSFGLRLQMTVGGIIPYIRQLVENVNTFAEQQVVGSFWVYNAGAATRNCRVRLGQIFGTGGSPAVDLTGSNIPCLPGQWTRVVFATAFPVIVGKVFGPNHALYMDLQLADLGAVYDIIATGAQLEPGTVATPFEFKPPGVELLMCQRYFQYGPASFTSYGLAGNGWGQLQPLVGFMRTTPTLNFSPTTTNNVNTPTITAVGNGHFANQASIAVTGTGINAGNWSANAELI